METTEKKATESTPPKGLRGKVTGKTAPVKAEPVMAETTAATTPEPPKPVIGDLAVLASGEPGVFDVTPALRVALRQTERGLLEAALRYESGTEAETLTGKVPVPLGLRDLANELRPAAASLHEYNKTRMNYGNAACYAAWELLRRAGNGKCPTRGSVVALVIAGGFRPPRSGKYGTVSDAWKFVNGYFGSAVTRRGFVTAA